MTIHGAAADGTCKTCGRARFALDVDIEALPDDPACLKFLIGELQFENGLLRNIIELGGGAHVLLHGGDCR